MNRVRSSCRIGLYLCFALAFLAERAFAQNGSIQGSVGDPGGAVIAGANVQAVDEGKNLVVRETTSASDGSFQLQPLTPGTYTIQASSAGMKQLEHKGIVLDVNQILNLGMLRLDLGATTESITVQATTPLVETSTANKAFVISPLEVTEISLNGRDFQSLMRTLPGVVSNDSFRFSAGIQ